MELLWENKKRFQIHFWGALTQGGGRTMYLVDTNILLEILLERKESMKLINSFVIAPPGSSFYQILACVS